MLLSSGDEARPLGARDAASNRIDSPSSRWDNLKASAKTTHPQRRARATGTWDCQAARKGVFPAQVMHDAPLLTLRKLSGL